MKPVATLLAKTIRIGPLPYLGLSLVILLVGVLLQLRAADPVMADGSTIFGLFARIGGFVGLFGLIPLFVGVQDDGSARTDESGKSERSDESETADGLHRDMEQTDRSLLSSLRENFLRRTA